MTPITSLPARTSFISRGEAAGPAAGPAADPHVPYPDAHRATYRFRARTAWQRSCHQYYHTRDATHQATLLYMPTTAFHTRSPHNVSNVPHCLNTKQISSRTPRSSDLTNWLRIPCVSRMPTNHPHVSWVVLTASAQRVSIARYVQVAADGAHAGSLPQPNTRRASGWEAANGAHATAISLTKCTVHRSSSVTSRNECYIALMALVQNPRTTPKARRARHESDNTRTKRRSAHHAQKPSTAYALIISRW